MSDFHDNAPRKVLLRSPSKAKQLDVSVKTLKRWAAAGILSPPKNINGRDYWDADDRPRADGEAA